MLGTDMDGTNEFDIWVMLAMGVLAGGLDPIMEAYLRWERERADAS